VKIIVDTNIIFSALLNSNGTIGDLVFNSDKAFEFYSCSYVQQEIQKHWEKLKKISKLSDEQLQTSYYKVLLKIRFINEELIAKKIWMDAERIVTDVDIDDIDFVALTKHLRGYLWTGDKELYTGLKNAGFKIVYNTQELLELRKAKLKE
jgi:predicted nucleic acid-binding protein